MLRLLFAAAGLLWTATTAAQPAGWTVDPSQFANAMVVTARVTLDGAPDGAQGDVVAAFVGTEVRGVTPAVFVPSLNAYRFVQTVYSNASSGEAVTFRWYDASAGTVRDLTPGVPFVTDDVVGSIGQPTVLAAGTGGSLPTALPELAVVASGSARPGQTLTVEVRAGTAAAPVSDLFGVGFDLDWDPAVMALTSITPGTLFPADARLTFQNLATGAFSVVLDASRRTAGVGGSGTVARFAFQVRADAPLGTTALSLTDVQAVHAGGSAYPLRAVAGSVVVANLVDVWPGDTDNSGVVTETDVLPLGAYFGQTGPARAGASLAWRAEPATPWATAAATFADATGDGRVSQNDLLGVGVNFGRTHATNQLSAGLADAHRSASAVLAVAPLPVGATFVVRLGAGTAEAPLVDVLGVAGRLALPTRTLAVRGVAVAQWLDDGDLLTFERVLDDGLAFAATRRSPRPSASGHGAVVDVTLEVVAAMAVPAEIRLTRLDAGGADGSIRELAGTLSLGQTAVDGEAPAGQPASFSLEPGRPNPFRTSTRIAFTLPESGQVHAVVNDAYGREIAVLLSGPAAAGRTELTWEPSGVSSGVYFVRVVSPVGTAVRQIVLTR